MVCLSTFCSLSEVAASFIFPANGTIALANVVIVFFIIKVVVFHVIHPALRTSQLNVVVIKGLATVKCSPPGNPESYIKWHF